MGVRLFIIRVFNDVAIVLTVYLSERRFRRDVFGEPGPTLGQHHPEEQHVEQHEQRHRHTRRYGVLAAC